ncbi:hypothetical protein WJX84_010026 [Apatococcus fuscideae]|uniref:Protein kinase domain-containing protein n=1 Tax=Apatococcus fuscideae TaxID=2026836 RepID=A0AAW1TA88_9CHLO
MPARAVLELERSRVKKWSLSSPGQVAEEQARFLLEDKAIYQLGNDQWQLHLSLFDRNVRRQLRLQQQQQQPPPPAPAGVRMVTLAGLMALALPALVYSHMLSTCATDNVYRAKPYDLSSWETFETEVAAACAALLDSKACHQPVAFPARKGGAFEVQDEASVNAYLCQYLYEPLENAFPLPGFTTCHQRDTWGAEAWQDPTLRKSISDGVTQLFGYMMANDMRYSLLTTGELFVFVQREGRSLRVADVHRTSRKPTPMAGIYYLMQWVMPMAAECPGKQLESDRADLTDPADTPLPTFLQAAFSAASWARQQLGRVAVHMASCLEELGLTAEIGCGRTGRVYEGCINGERVAVKVLNQIWLLLEEIGMSS